MIEHDNIFYIEYISEIGGVETFVYEIAKKYKDYDIAILSKKIDIKQYERLSELCPVYVFNKKFKYKCKKIFTNYDSSILDHVKFEESYEVIHADYSCPMYKIYPNINKKVNHWIGITEYSRKKFEEMFGVKTELSYNPITLEPIKKIKPLILVSATRLSPIKGKDRMEALCKELDKQEIPYTWYVFTNDTNGLDSENVIFKKPTLNIRPWIANADYVVQLSDSECLSYTINEALGYNVPVIVTPLPYLEEIGYKDKEHGYTLEFDLSNIEDVVKNITNMPKFKFELPNDNYDNLIVKSKSKYDKIKKQFYEVEATDIWERLSIQSKDLGYIPKLGERWKVDYKRLQEMINHKYHLINIIKD